MIQPWITVLVAILYISILFAVASYGDRVRVRSQRVGTSKPNIYALSLAIYCTTWTFFGSVGLASTNGLSFLAIYVGPVLLVTLGLWQEQQGRGSRRNYCGYWHNSLYRTSA